MSIRYITDCELTHETSYILKYWSRKSLESQSHTGIDVSGTNVYSLCYGVVIAVEHDNDGQSVTVQYNDDICVRYCHLSYVKVNVGEAIQYEDEIGTCNRYVHFEYCTSSMSESDWAVRVDDLTFYKCNPLPVLLDREAYISDYREGSDVNDSGGLEYAEVDVITEDVLNEFQGGYA